MVNVISEEHKDYRTWMYNKIDGEMLSKIVTSDKAKLLFEDGWKMTPAEFTDDEELKGSPEFIALADDMSQLLNFLINIELCNDKTALMEFATGFMKLNPRKNSSVVSLRTIILNKAEEIGLYNDNS